MKYFPRLVALFDSFYLEKPSLLCIRSDDLEKNPFIYSCQGVQQGDSLGPLFFALGSLDFMLELQQKITPSSSSGTVLAYLDDVTVVANEAKCREIIQHVVENGPDIGLYLNKSKSLVTSTSKEIQDRYLDIFPEDAINRDSGFCLLGTPFGSDAFILSWLSKYLEKEFSSVADEVKNYPDAQSQFAFLNYCICSKYNHLFRGVATDILNMPLSSSSDDNTPALSFVQRLQDIQVSLFCSIADIEVDAKIKEIANRKNQKNGPILYHFFFFPVFKA